MIDLMDAYDARTAPVMHAMAIMKFQRLNMVYFDTLHNKPAISQEDSMDRITDIQARVQRDQSLHESTLESCGLFTLYGLSPDSAVLCITYPSIMNGGNV